VLPLIPQQQGALLWVAEGCTEGLLDLGPFHSPQIQAGGIHAGQRPAGEYQT
jgi:hypothetical protein